MRAPTQQLDQHALEQLYVELERPMYNIVYRWLWNADDAQEVVQEAFVRLWKMRSRVELATVRPLLYRIALNLASNRRRARMVWRVLSLEAVRGRASQHPDAERALGEREEALALRAAIEQLPEASRRIIMLCEFSDLSHKQIGTLLGIPAGTVGSRRHTALKRLKQLMRSEEAP